MKSDNRLPNLLIEIAQNRILSTYCSCRAPSIRAGLLGLTSLLIALTAFAAQARTHYPKAESLYVNDFANVLTTADRTAVRTVLAKLRSDAGIEAVVVTIRSIHNYKTGDQSIESFATNLFNTWGIGDRQRNDGVLILVAVKDRKIRIEVGSGYGSQLNTKMQNVISEQMIPHFRNKNYSLGIVEGTNAVVRILSEHVSTMALPPTPMPAAGGSVRPSESNDLVAVSLFLLAGGAIAGTFGLIWYIRYRRGRCPHCKAGLIRPDEASEDQYLNVGQKLEKSLGTVNYQVWQCPGCNYHTLRSDNARFSSFDRCYACGYRTLQVSDLVLSQPTHVTTGLKQITKNCHHCQYFHQAAVVLAMLPPPSHHRNSQSSSFHTYHSDSDSSSSFGFDSGSSSNDSSSSSFDGGGSSSDSFSGGSSSGDGSSGSW